MIRSAFSAVREMFWWTGGASGTDKVLSHFNPASGSNGADHVSAVEISSFPAILHAPDRFQRRVSFFSFDNY